MTRKILLTSFVAMFCLSGCERLGSVNISIEGGNLPVFNVSGSGNLLGIYVYGPRPGETIAVPDEILVWAIRVKPDGSSEHTYGGYLLDSVGRVQYGVAPSRFEQRFPKGGVSASKLKDGIIYMVHLETTSAYDKSVLIQVREGKASEVRIPNLCFEKRADSRWEKVLCGTQSPFPEPR